MKNKQKSPNLEKIMDEIDVVVDDIKSIKIQWATNVARAAFVALRQGILSAHFANKEEFYAFLKESIGHLVSARATEPMLQNGMKCALWTYEKVKNKSLSDIVAAIDETLQDFLDEIYAWDKLGAGVGAELVKNGNLIMTHCHSGSVVKVIRSAWESGKKFEMVNTETRPLYQGRITAQDMMDIGVPTTLITDDMWPYYIDETYADTPNIDMLIIGCDAIKPDGSIINKVWSFSLALSAWYNKIPVYIVGSLTKLDAEDKVKIELRDGREIWPTAPEDLNILNFAFDTVPAKFITWFITKFGVVKPEDVMKNVKTDYPWIVENKK